MKNCVIIVAGGNGSRMESEIPKQFLPLNGIPVLMHTIRQFYTYDPGMKIIVVLPEAEAEKWKLLCTAHDFHISHNTVTGGETRFHSVRNGLSAITECDCIAVHDGVRPLVSQETISACFEKAYEKGAVIPVIPANESIREGTMDNSKPLDRTRLFMVQTPQVFNYIVFKTAYKQEYTPEFTDDASVVEKSGFPVSMILGNRENIKITFPEDIEIASLLIKE